MEKLTRIECKEVNGLVVGLTSVVYWAVKLALRLRLQDSYRRYSLVAPNSLPLPRHSTLSGASGVLWEGKLNFARNPVDFGAAGTKPDEAGGCDGMWRQDEDAVERRNEQESFTTHLFPEIIIFRPLLSAYYSFFLPTFFFYYLELSPLL